MISSEDLLAAIQDCNDWVREEIKRKTALGESVDEEEEIYLIGCDVVALFPSLMSRNTGIIVREQVEKSDMVVEGANYKQVAKYVRIGKDLTGPLGKL